MPTTENAPTTKGGFQRSSPSQFGNGTTNGSGVWFPGFMHSLFPSLFLLAVTLQRMMLPVGVALLVLVDGVIPGANFSTFETTCTFLYSLWSLPGTN